MPLEISVAHWCLQTPDAQVATAYHALADAGITAIEMPPDHLAPAAVKAGLSIHNLAAPGIREPALNDPANHEAMLPQLRDAITHAAALHARQLIVFSGNRLGQTDSHGADATAHALRQLTDRAQRHRVTLTLELLNTHDHPGYMADRTAWAVDVVERVDSPRVKLLYDVYHMHRMHQPIFDDLEQYRDLIAHVHVAGSPTRGFPGPDQQIDYARLISHLRDIGYTGRIGLEFHADPNQAVTQMAAAADLFRRFAAHES
ncbi:MAG: TIM barrel protein [Planctomycetota bacterium]